MVEEWITATEAAKQLGNPRIRKTLMRRAKEAEARSDKSVRRIGRYWLAPLSWWREAAKPRNVGRPSSPKHT